VWLPVGVTPLPLLQARTMTWQVPAVDGGMLQVSRLPATQRRQSPLPAVGVEPRVPYRTHDPRGRAIPGGCQEQ
jgi:hypothetical protein